MSCPRGILLNIEDHMLTLASVGDADSAD
jgi:hypothetical protein